MFSIIIPTLNNLDYLRVCLNSLKKNSTFNNEIIVHVNIGSDGTKKFLKENDILYTFSENNLGLCKAVNLAAQKASTDYILYSHDDFYFCPKWDEVLYKEMKSINHKRFYLSSTQVNTFGFDIYNCGKNYKDFKVYILYVGVKNYIFKVEGLDHYAGFSFMETNKGIIVHDNVVDDSKLLAKDLKDLFTKNYRSPYAITDTFLNFINSDPKKKN